LAAPFLSLIIPAFNEENRLPRTLSQVFTFTEKQPFSSEVLIAENGSTDRTYEIAREFVQRRTNARVLRMEQRGKGAAVRGGILAARGDYRFICDADLSMPIDEVNKFLPPALTDYDVAIGSRELPGSRRYDEPSYRHWGGRAINFAIQTLILPGLNDTQCGFKCFRAQAAEDLFARQTLSGWSFDIEILYLARRRGYRIKEVAINWHFGPESKVSAVTDALRMLTDIFRIRLRALLGRYER